MPETLHSIHDYPNWYSDLTVDQFNQLSEQDKDYVTIGWYRVSLSDPVEKTEADYERIIADINLD